MFNVNLETIGGQAPARPPSPPLLERCFIFLRKGKKTVNQIMYYPSLFVTMSRVEGYRQNMYVFSVSAVLLCLALMLFILLYLQKSLPEHAYIALYLFLTIFTPKDG